MSECRIPLADVLDPAGVAHIAAEVTAINTDTGTVTTADGVTYGYDRLVLASGSQVVKPAIAGDARVRWPPSRSSIPSGSIPHSVGAGPNCSLQPHQICRPAPSRVGSVCLQLISGVPLHRLNTRLHGQFGYQLFKLCRRMAVHEEVRGYRDGIIGLS